MLSISCATLVIVNVSGKFSLQALKVSLAAFNKKLVQLMQVDRLCMITSGMLCC